MLEGFSSPELVRVLVDLGSVLAVSLHEQRVGIAYTRRALELAQHLGDDRLVAAASRALGNLLVRSNDLGGGIPLLERALALATAADDPVEAAECCACLAPAFFWQGHLARSREVTLQRLAFARRCHDPYQLRHVHIWLAVVAGLQGKPAEAEESLDRAQAIVARLASLEPRAYLQFCRGALAYERGDYGVAEARLQEATALFREIGPGALIWYLGFLGLVQAAQGNAPAARARDLLEHAVDLARRLGNPSVEQRLLQRLLTLERRRPQRPRLPAGLSVREAEVLRLVAAGKSNREIAEALSLSESTVAHHLTSILTKTGVDNRAAATAFAIRQGLA